MVTTSICRAILALFIIATLEIEVVFALRNVWKEYIESKSTGDGLMHYARCASVHFCDLNVAQERYNTALHIFDNVDAPSVLRPGELLSV